MSNKDPIFLCFPGFLGLPSDFKFLEEFGLPIEVVDLCGRNAPSEGQTWADWESQLLHQFKSEFEGQKVIVVGYSMGARVALRILSQNPSWIAAAILISCHPGLKTEPEKIERMANDNYWANRFQNDDWISVIESWNKQPSLLNSFEPQRKEAQFSKETLARVLETFSLSRQDSIVDGCILAPSLICWGQRDLKFSGLANCLIAAFKHKKTANIPDAGHRVIFDNPSYLIEIIKDFKRSIYI